MSDHETALLVCVKLPNSKIEIKDSLNELESLAQAAGAEVVGRVRQNRRTIHPGLFVGKGKADEIAEKAKDLEASSIIF